VHTAGFLCVLFAVEFVQHPMAVLACMGRMRISSRSLLLREVDMHFQCSAEQSVADLVDMSLCPREGSSLNVQSVAR